MALFSIFIYVLIPLHSFGIFRISSRLVSTDDPEVSRVSGHFCGSGCGVDGRKTTILGIRGIFSELLVLRVKPGAE